MFTLEDTKALVESVNTGTPLSEEEKTALAGDVHKKLTEAFEAYGKEIREKTLSEAKEEFRKERVKSYDRGRSDAKSVTESLVREAEENGYEAGKADAEAEAATRESEVSEEMVAKLEQLCKEFDKSTRLIEYATHEASKEYFKESTKPLISQFIQKTITESFPKQLVLDYDRMQRMEAMCESFKKSLLLTDADVSEAVKQARASVENELVEAKNSLREQTQKRISAEKLLGSVQSENLLLQKVAALPTAEQKVMLESFKGKSAAEINESFDREHLKYLRRTEAAKPVVTDIVNEATQKKAEENAAAASKTVSESTAAAETSANKPETVMDAYVRGCKIMSI